MKFYLTTLLFILISTLGFSEGTLQLITCPDCEAGLSINDKAQFAYPTIDADRRLYIRIGADAVNERIYVALSEQWYVQIKSPDGSRTFVYNGTGFVENGTPSPFPFLGNGVITGYNQSSSGPNGVTQKSVGNPTTGSYNSIVFNPDEPGDWYIEFTDNAGMGIPSEGARCAYWDISVVDASSAANNVIDGRIWAYQWGMRSGPGSTPPGPGPRLNSTFYIYTDEQVVTSIEVGSPDNPGWGGDWFIACNDFGIIETADPGEARKSINGDADDIHGFLGQYRIFMNDPDIIEFPSGIDEIDVSTVAIDLCADGGSFITFNTNVDGVADVTLDFPPYVNDGPEDILLAAQGLTAGANSVEWNGLDGNGNAVTEGTVFKIRLFIGASIVHLPLYDIEGLTGLKAQLVRPGTPGYIGLYWDNSNILGGTTETVDPGCMSTDNSVCNAYGYSNEITLNNWWNGLAVNVEADIVTPSAIDSSLDVDESTAVCTQDPITDEDNILVDLSANVVNINSVVWETTGTGTFDDMNDPGTVYNVSDADFTAGTVTLTLRGAACPDVASSIAVNIPDNVCNLPITLTSFKGIIANAEDHCDGVAVTWITATEENTDYFILLRSSNGINFTEVDRITAAGNSTTQTVYTIIDENAGELNYYKLITHDFDGTQEEILMDNTVGTDCIVPINTISEMYPNPATREGQNISLTININDAADVNVNIVDIHGRLVKKLEMSLIPGINPIQFDVNNLPSGAYFVNISSNDWRTGHKKLIKVK